MNGAKLLQNAVKFAVFMSLCLVVNWGERE